MHYKLPPLLSTTLALGVLLSLAGTALASGAEILREDFCEMRGEYEVCLQRKEVFHRVETPLGMVKESAKGTLTTSVTAPDGTLIQQTTTDYRRQQRTVDSEVRQLKDQQHYASTSGGATCDLELAYHRVNGTEKHNEQTYTCSPG